MDKFLFGSRWLAAIDEEKLRRPNSANTDF
jgi:hypothetical protein